MVEEKKKKINNKKDKDNKGLGCCKIEAIVNVDERGQMVLPKEIREKAKIRPGDKLAIMVWEREEKVCCISCIKVEDFTKMAKELLTPVVKEIIREEK